MSRKLALLVMLAVLPALLILLYSGIEQRRKSIEYAKNNVFQLTHTMAKAQQEITHSTKQILSTLSILPAIQTIDTQASTEIFKSVLEQNPNYSNISLVDLNGDVLASGRTFIKTNLADRKHVREALEKKDFAVGEYITLRFGTSTPAFAFAYPVLDKMGSPKAILTMVIKLANFSSFHDISNLPEGSFVAITDHKGIRLLYYPSKKSTNPVGKPIKAKSWQRASATQDPGIFIGTGSDGQSRIFAFEQVRLTPEDSPYLYVWAAIPEAHIIGPANATLIRNLLLMLLVTVISLFISWLIGKKTETLIKKLEKAFKEIKALRGIIPICSYCHSIRDDEGAWNMMEKYITSHSDAQFSHGICPKCLEQVREETGLNEK
jgi:hypothetical protein